MLDYRIKNMLVDICQTFSSNETDEIVAEIVAEIYRLKGFEKGQDTRNIKTLLDEIDSLEYQIRTTENDVENLERTNDELKSEIGDLRQTISELEDKIEELSNE